MRRAFPEPSDLRPSHPTTTPRRAPAQPAAAPPRVAASPPPGAWWNGIAHAWFVAAADGEAVRLDPQPAAPGVRLVSSVPPAVKVSA